jgi:hypothetical protein
MQGTAATYVKRRRYLSSRHAALKVFVVNQQLVDRLVDLQGGWHRAFNHIL